MEAELGMEMDAYLKGQFIQQQLEEEMVEMQKIFDSQQVSGLSSLLIITGVMGYGEMAGECG